MAQNTQKQLEAAYNRGLSLEKSGRFAEAAQAYAEVLALDKQDCAGVAVRLAAMGLGAAPKTAPKAYVATLFNQYADVFDMILVDKLGYDVPNLLRAEFDRLYPQRLFGRLLDLGCGTGLAAEAFADLADHKTGLDLAENMVEIADERQIYDTVFVGDIIRFLQQQSQAKWDLILAADVLPYIGALAEFFALVSQNLHKGGIFAFSSEDLAAIKPTDLGAGFTVGPHQRFAHSAAYIKDSLLQAGLKTEYCADIIVRQEQNAPVHGQIFIAAKA